MNAISGMILPGGVFLLTAVFGFWTSRVGRPYPGLLFNVHKLTALAGVILASVRLSRIFHLAAFPTWMILLLALAAVSVIALFITGVLMSIREQEQRPAVLIHQAMPGLIALAALSAFCLLR